MPRVNVSYTFNIQVAYTASYSPLIYFVFVSVGHLAQAFIDEFISTHCSSMGRSDMNRSSHSCSH